MKKKYILPVLLLLVLLVGIGALWQYNQPARNLTNEKAELGLTAANLYQQFAANEATANQQYLGKVVQVRGKLKDVSRGQDGSLNLTLEAGSLLGGVICEVPGANIPEGLNLRTGREITVKGQCTGFLTDVLLVKCVIVP